MGTHLLIRDKDSMFVSDMKERIKCNLEICYASACVSQLIDKNSFIEVEMLTVLSRVTNNIKCIIAGYVLDLE